MHLLIHALTRAIYTGGGARACMLRRTTTAAVVLVNSLEAIFAKDREPEE